MFKKFSFGTLPFATKKQGTRVSSRPRDHNEQDYPGPRLSEVRMPVFWGGFFSRSRYCFAMAHAKLPKLRVYSEKENHPEVVVVTGGRRTGKNTLVSHWVKEYATGNIKFPIFFLSTGDELKMRDPIRDQYTGRQVENFQSIWRQGGKITWYPKTLPNVVGLAPPYKSQRILDEVDEIFYVNPKDMTRQLFLSMTMLKADAKAGATAQPQYMQLATDIERLIREEGATPQRCKAFIEEWCSYHPEAFDRRAGKKVEGAINDIFRKVLRDDAPTMEERILERRGGYPITHIIHFGESEQGDRYFGEHIVGSIALANEKNRLRMYPQGQYISPAIIIDEARVFVPYTGSSPVPNRIVEHVEMEGKYAGPIIFIAQLTRHLDSRIINPVEINNAEIYRGGAWSHLFKTFDDQSAIYTTKLQKSEWTVTGQDDNGDDIIKHFSELDVHETMKYMEENPPHPKFRAIVKPAETYSPT